MAIRTVITRGFGNGTFNGTVPLVVTRGYAIGVEAPDIGLDAPAVPDTIFRPVPGGAFTPEQLAGLRIEAAKALSQRGLIRRVTLTPDGQGGFTETVEAIYTNVACRLSPPLPSARTNPAREVLQGGTLKPDTTLMLSTPWDVRLRESDRIWIDGIISEVAFVNAPRTIDTVRRSRVRRVG